ncbi:HAMP domain-containing protein [Pseudonocardiaceae bacterium YIM PH 21723]|nr:HAMP domain-containing protein [Pseudonocardiaceae bacterium YIM PH 21723]
MRDRPDRRKSLVFRLLAGSIAVAACSIAATAWLASRSTSGAIRTEQGKELGTDNRIYDELLGYASVNSTWAGAQALVDQLSRQTGKRIILATDKREVMLQSAGSSGTPLTATPTANIDPLAVDVSSSANAGTDGVDRRATGPFTLPEPERRKLEAQEARVRECLGKDVAIDYAPNRHPYVRGTGVTQCTADRKALQAATPTEAAALELLNRYVQQCLADPDYRPYTLEPSADGLLSKADGPGRQKCLTAARRQLLTPSVAPAALLFINHPERSPGYPLSNVGTANLVLTALIVLLLTGGVTVLIGTRLTRPLRELTSAAVRMRREDVPTTVPVRSRDEIGELAAALNELSEHRGKLADLRRSMVSDLSHELRSPLSNIRGWLEAVEDGVAEMTPRLTRSLLEETMLLGRLVDDLQDLALADAGGLPLHRQDVLVREVLDQAAMASPDAEVTVRVSGEPRVFADPGRLRQVVGNLVTNAVRYSPDGAPITLRAKENGDRVSIEVADSGPGIAAEDLPHVFDRFWRAEKSRNRATGGSGLGLAIVRQLVRAHGGDVSVRSALGEGSTFTISLPKHD